MTDKRSNMPGQKSKRRAASLSKVCVRAEICPSRDQYEIYSGGVQQTITPYSQVLRYPICRGRIDTVLRIYLESGSCRCASQTDHHQSYCQFLTLNINTVFLICFADGHLIYIEHCCLTVLPMFYIYINQRKKRRHCESVLFKPPEHKYSFLHASS